jgi:hypothetical protein
LTARYQLRGRQDIVLSRLDFDRPHRNPDGVEIEVPHLHLYREGFGDKFAEPVPIGMLSDPSDPWQCLLDFMDYFRIIEFPLIDNGLFASLNVKEIFE